MVSIGQTSDSFLQGILQREEGPSPAPAQGKLQGRHVQVRPQAQTITPAPAEQAASTPVEAPPLEQRQARPASAPPALVRQARYGALPSSTQLLLPSGGSDKVVQPRGLPSTGQLIARAGPAKSHSLLERFLNLFRSGTPSTDYKDILTGLKAYHDACRTGTAQDATARLDELSRIMDRYSRGGDGNHHRAGVIENLRRQITSERATLTNLVAELKDGVLPQGATLSHALAFIREEVSLKEMTRLIDKGLELDQTQEAREILQGEKLSTAYEGQPADYRKILANLEKYHAACGAHSAQGDTGAAEQALKLLDNLKATTERYLRNNTDPRAKALKDLNDQVSIERRVLQGLLDELRNGGTLPEGADLSHALAFAREGVSLQDMNRLMDKGLLPSQATDARVLLDSERAASLMDDLDSRTPEEKALLTSQFSEGEILLLQLSGLGRNGGDAYRELGIPITRQTVVAEHTDEQRLDDMSKLGNGASNTVYAARYSGPDGIAEGIFKPMANTEGGWVADKIGIDLDHPQIANRNLATQDMARALGFDVVVDCKIGSCLQRLPSGGQKLQIGLVMGRAPGQPACNTETALYDNPEVRREITKLQLLDHLVGQGDRHDGNYFIHAYKDERGQAKAKVSGIDNDQCFGKNTTQGNDIRYVKNDKQREGFRGTLMPELIDTDMAAAIRSITPQRLTAMLNDKLSPEEVSAAQSRLQSVLEHVDKLEKKNQVLTPAAWNAQATRSPLQTKENSYFARAAGYGVPF